MPNTDKNIVPIVKMAMNNDAFRDEVITGKECQVVLMDPSSPAKKSDQKSTKTMTRSWFLSKARDKPRSRRPGPPDRCQRPWFFVHAGAEHNFINTGTKPLRL